MSQLQDVSYGLDDREFARFRASVLTVLSARPELRRLGFLLQGDDGFRLVSVDGGVSSVLDLWSWLVSNATTLVREETHFAALIIPRDTSGAIHEAPSDAGLAVFGLEVWMVDDAGRVETTGFRCTAGRTELVRQTAHTTAVSPADAIAVLLGRMLTEHHEPPPTPTRLLRPSRHQASVEFDAMAMAA
jgi:hypothetical protein